MKVEQFYNKNQFVIYGKGETIFQSYNSTIAIIKDGFLTLSEDWNYSKTTMKHLYLFLEDYYFELDKEYKLYIHQVLNSKNKKQAIQKLIDEKHIKVSEVL